MKRALAWTIGGFTVLTLGLVVALWVGTAPRPVDSPSPAAAALPAPSAPARASVPTSAPAAFPPGADAGAATAPGAAPSAAVPQTPAGALEATAPDAAAELMIQRRQERDRVIQEHRMEVKERAQAHRERRELRHAQALERRAIRQAMRQPDPNRPPVEQLSHPSGPTVIPAPGASSSR